MILSVMLALWITDTLHGIPPAWIGLAAAVLAHRDEDAIIGSFAADHMISGDDAFLSAVAEAVEVAGPRGVA